MENEDATELMIRIGMPIVAGGSIFLMTFFSFVFLMDNYIFKTDTGGPVFLMVLFGLILFGIFYCFHYSKNRLGYFVDPEKKWKHMILLVIIPIFLGAAMGVQRYQVRMVSLKNSQSTEDLSQGR